MSFMSCLIRACHQYIVEVDEHKLHLTQNAIHQSLESLRRVLQTEWHAQKFEKTKWGDDGRLRDILIGHWYLMKSSNQVYHGENLHACQLSIKILDVW